MRKTFLGVATLALAALLALAPDAHALEVGDEAPAFELKEWVYGEEVTPQSAKGEKVLVVQFFATYDATSRERLPDLVQLQKDFLGQGLIVVSISNEKPDAMRKWLEEQDLTPGMRFAADDSRNTQGTWFEGPERYPYCYVLDRGGVVAWQGPAGHDDLRETVEKVVSGELDAGSAKEMEATEKAIAEALKTKDWATAIEHIRKLVELDAENTRYDRAVRGISIQEDDPGMWFDFVELIEQKVDDPMRRNWAAWELVTGPNKYRDPVLSLKLAKPAAEAAEPDQKASIIDTVARAYYIAGKLSQAISEQKRAIAAGEAAIKAAEEGDRSGMEDAQKGLKETLDYYERMLAASKQVK